MDHCQVKMMAGNVHLHGSKLATARVCNASYSIHPVSERAGSCEHDLCSHEVLRVAKSYNTSDVMSRAIRDIVLAAQMQPRSSWSAAIVGRDGMLAAFLLADAFTWHHAACTISFENGREYAADAGCGCENHVMVLHAAKMLMRTKMWYGFGYPEGPALHYNKYISLLICW